MKGYYPEYKPHLRMAAAKELIRQIEFDYDDEPSETATASVASTPEPATSSESNSDSQPTNPVNPTHPVNPASDNPEITAHQPNQINHSSDNNPRPTNPVNPTHPVNPASEKITVHQDNHKNHSSDQNPEWMQDFANPYTQYAIRNCAEEAESIYRSIIRRSADRPDLDSAKHKAAGLMEEFNKFMAERDPEYEPITVPEDLLAKSLTQRMEAPESYVFDPAEYYDFDRDDFYFCRCGGCEECDELDYFFEFMRELEEDIEAILEDP